MCLFQRNFKKSTQKTFSFTLNLKKLSVQTFLCWSARIAFVGFFQKFRGCRWKERFCCPFPKVWFLVLLRKGGVRRWSFGSFVDVGDQFGQFCLEKRSLWALLTSSLGSSVWKKNLFVSFTYFILYKRFCLEVKYVNKLFLAKVLVRRRQRGWVLDSFCRLCCVWLVIVSMNKYRWLPTTALLVDQSFLIWCYYKI